METEHFIPTPREDSLLQRSLSSSCSSLSGSETSFPAEIESVGDVQNTHVCLYDDERELENDYDASAADLPPTFGLPPDCLLRDAQRLKFENPESQWAPDIEELEYLEPPMRVMLSMSQTKENTPVERFWVTVQQVVTEEDRSNDENEKCRVQQQPSIPERETRKSKLIIGIVEDDLEKFDLHAGNVITFGLKHVVNVHTKWKDVLYSRHIDSLACSKTFESSSSLSSWKEEGRNDLCDLNDSWNTRKWKRYNSNVLAKTLGLPAGCILRDAQWLKFKNPELYWAPDIEELEYLEPPMQVMLSITEQEDTSYVERFWVTVRQVVVEDEHYPHHAARKKFRSHPTAKEEDATTAFAKKSTKVIIGVVDEDLHDFELFSGSIITFDLRHIANVHVNWKDALYTKHMNKLVTTQKAEEIVNAR